MTADAPRAAKPRRARARPAGPRAGRPVAVIDIGSNSGRVVVMRLTTLGHLDVLADERASLQLVSALDRRRRLRGEAVERIVVAMSDFLQIARSTGARTIVAVGTAALREAANGREIVARIERAAKIPLRILSGDEEARYSFLGAAHGLPVENGAVLDLGGGSLEIIRFRRRRLVETWTLPLGALRMSREFFVADPPARRETGRLEAHVAAQLRGARACAAARRSSAPVARSGTSRTSTSAAADIRCGGFTDTS